ncbi:MAG UNVERIFIED_CONTAM: hypothetical protein LVQ98_01435 [Rickettsiaceae bacterium]|jgi:hypothetical protein
MVFSVMILSNQASDTSMENFNNILAKDDMPKRKKVAGLCINFYAHLLCYEYYYNEASIYHATLVFNGLPNNSFKELSDFDRASI